MNKILFIATALAIAAPAEAAFARWNDNAAKQACRQEARGQLGARGFHGIVVNRKGRNEFVVTGVAERRGNRSDVSFKCRVANGRIVQFKKTGNSDSDAARVAAGVLLGAAVIGALSTDHRHDDHRYSNNRPGTRDSGAFSPASGVTCHNFTQMCYVGGHYSQYWTRREYY